MRSGEGYIIVSQASEDLFSRLSSPFPAECLEWKSIEINASQHKAFVVPFVALRHYVSRINQVTPLWENQIEVIGPGDYIRNRLTIQGISKEGIGDAIPGDCSLEGKQNRAFIRACQSFGLGKYLQYLPCVWVDYDPATKTIVSIPPLPEWALIDGINLPTNIPGNQRFSKRGKPQNIESATKSQVRSCTPVIRPQVRQKHIQVAPEKQAGGDIANAQALKAWGDLVLEAKTTGIYDIESICPPITVENLRKRYMALKEQLVELKEA